MSADPENACLCPLPALYCAQMATPVNRDCMMHGMNAMYYYYAL